MKWKKGKNAYRLTIQINEPDDECYTFEEDILESELTPDNMSDFFTYFDWFANDGYEILSAKPVEIFEWKEMIIKHKWRHFYELFGDGCCLSID